ncbi:hypothetical protein AND_000853 [Anopheles darlingi]|uniref:Uncharacterized protein n=1 Tax=Anopheles darlingi TaxID=43151 RepID=W5JW41_ANODA|nr:hypothetical protein AND_000853 [Anopheles darlingi]
MDPVLVKNIELDKICRICLVVKKEMRPLFGEMVAEMLMEIAKIEIENSDGWPDKICVQCIHQVSRCHAFKTRVEKSDIALRQYIKGITVLDDHQVKNNITTIELPKITLGSPKLQPITQPVPSHLHELHLHRADVQPIQTEPPTVPTMILTGTQLINGPQIINAGHIITTATGQQILQATPQYQATQIGQFIHGPNNTVQMITHNGNPAHVLHIQRTVDDCEIIVQPEMAESQYLENVSALPMMVAAPNTTIPTDQLQAQQLHAHITSQQHEQHHHVSLEESETHSQLHQKLDEDIDCVLVEDEAIETDEIIEEDDGADAADVEYYPQTDCEESDEEVKQLEECVTYQSSCPSPSPGSYICNLCYKEFSQPKWLQKHMSQHANWIKANCKKQPECEICGKSFRGPGMLRMHMKTHEKVNKIPTCSICNTEFKTKSILYRHRQTHFEKKFECNICGKKYNSRYQLNIHEHRHEVQKTHTCQHCERSFFNETELTNHIKQHMGIKVKKNKKPVGNRS